MRRVLIACLLATAACSRAPIPGVVRVIATPAPAPDPTINTATASPTPTPARATKAPTPTPPTPAPAPPPIPEQLASFRGLGSWIDVFDYNDDPNSILPLVRGMARRGVDTLYLETARVTSPADIQYPNALGAAVDEAKGLGLRVVAWYPPGFDDLQRDVRRTLVAIRFVSPKGHHFDGFGADIEYTTGVPNHQERSRRAVDYSQQIRALAGAAYPLAAIVIPPSFLAHKPDRWPGYPWAGLRPSYDVFMPMSYWTAFGKNPQTASDVTSRDLAETRRLTARPVHIIGGLAADADEAQVSAYVTAAREGGSMGGGLYDYATTRDNVWDELRLLSL